MKNNYFKEISYLIEREKYAKSIISDRIYPKTKLEKIISRLPLGQGTLILLVVINLFSEVFKKRASINDAIFIEDHSSGKIRRSIGDYRKMINSVVPIKSIKKLSFLEIIVLTRLISKEISTKKIKEEDNVKIVIEFFISLLIYRNIFSSYNAKGIIIADDFGSKRMGALCAAKESNVKIFVYKLSAETGRILPLIPDYICCRNVKQRQEHKNIPSIFIQTETKSNYISINDKEKLNLHIVLNAFVNIAGLKRLYNQLVENENVYKVSLCLHPRSNKKDYIHITNNFSTTDEIIASGANDIAVAGNTSAIEKLILNNKIVIYNGDSDNAVHDLYGYVKNSMVFEIPPSCINSVVIKRNYTKCWSERIKKEIEAPFESDRLEVHIDGLLSK